MAVIFQQDFTRELGREGLRLRNEEFVRTLSIGTSWTRLRIGIQCAIGTVDSQNFVTGSMSGMFLGLCVGTTFPFSNPSCTYAVGYTFYPGQTWTYVANSGNPYYQVPGFQHGPTSKVNAVLTSPSVGIATTFIASSDATHRRSVYMVDITRSSTIITMGTSAVAAVTYDWTTRDFLNVVDQGAATASIFYQGTQYDVATTRSDTIAGMNANLDSIDIFWRQTANPLEIYGIAVSRLA